VTATPEPRGFKTTLLIPAALAIAIALLFSSIHIRRRHRPLASRVGDPRCDEPTRRPRCAVTSRPRDALKLTLEAAHPSRTFHTELPGG
jgi:hypothetical protein